MEASVPDVEANSSVGGCGAARLLLVLGAGCISACSTCGFSCWPSSALHRASGGAGHGTCLVVPSFCPQSAETSPNDNQRLSTIHCPRPLPKANGDNDMTELDGCTTWANGNGRGHDPAARLGHLAAARMQTDNR